ncbi:hypothetical protein NPIL_564561 [Nephila pilipes]|uniref:Uncharacterized protein n=1 Tax=Nephila pilipes TaxID=299642 RepID=A0A8X6PMI0_NEPPI|nr:hypothetical protein NPIL_564561 [Nephila pilipes]
MHSSQDAAYLRKRSFHSHARRSIRNKHQYYARFFLTSTFEERERNSNVNPPLYLGDLGMPIHINKVADPLSGFPAKTWGALPFVTDLFFSRNAVRKIPAEGKAFGVNGTKLSLSPSDPCSEEAGKWCFTFFNGREGSRCQENRC